MNQCYFVDEVLLIDYDVASTPVDSSIVREIPNMYETVLDNLLTLPHVKANLVEVVISHFDTVHPFFNIYRFNDLL